jgi:hypothetical protein
VQIAGVAALVTTVEWIAAPSAIVRALVLTIFGYGQGLVMAPLSSAVLSRRSARCSLRSGRGSRLGPRYSRHPRCLRCRLSPAPHF